MLEKPRAWRGPTVHTMDLAQLFDEARKGNRDAAWQLGDLYREAAQGVKYSPKQAFRWYAESALAGSPTGQNNVGAAFENGFGCQQNYAKAAKWYRLAATQGLHTAMANLAFLYLHGYGIKQDKAEALRWFKRGAAAGCKKSKKMVEAVLGADRNK
ncbi:MAG TPA: tetratricopeptide repeat protein [Steroidobacteraceae bacterium]|nr:tetratricopeptide repeat protein [Steroidobacteraceae bacterium]